MWRRSKPRSLQNGPLRVNVEGAGKTVAPPVGVCFAPDGSTDRVIEMLVEKVTSVMFGGPNLDVLYVASMAKRPLPRFAGDGVLRGSLFAIYGLGIRGVPESRFAS